MFLRKTAIPLAAPPQPSRKPLVLQPHHARMVARVLAPSAALAEGCTALRERGLKAATDALAAPQPATGAREVLKRAAIKGALQGVQVGDRAAYGLFGVSCATQLLLPRWAASRLPIPGLLGWAPRGCAGGLLQTLGVGALDLAARRGHRRLQLAVLAALVGLAVLTEPMRLSAALIAAGLPAVGAVVGATAALLAGAYRVAWDAVPARARAPA